MDLQQIFLEYGTYETFIPKAVLTFSSIKHLKTYLKQHEESYQNLFQDRPVEVVYKGILLDESEKIPEKTTKDNRIHFYLKFLKEPDQSSTEEYFKLRDWDFYKMKEINTGLSVLVENLQDKNYPYNHKALVEEFHKLSARNNTFKIPLIPKIITSVLYSTEGYRLEKDFEICAGLDHKVKADYVLHDSSENAVLIITEAKEGKDMSSAVIENLDLLKSYSLMKSKEEIHYFFGIVTDGEKWRFTAYIRPIENEPEREMNFLISHEYHLEFIRRKILVMVNNRQKIDEVFVMEPEEKTTEMIVQMIRGFIFRANKVKIFDFVVLQGQESMKKIMEFQARPQNEDGCPVLLPGCDFGFLLKSERDRLLRKFKEGEVLMDVFAESGVLSVRAAKLGLKVFANELRQECNYFIGENVKSCSVHDLVKYYDQDTRRFIRKIIKNEKVNHICMFQPNDSLQYLDELTQAFSQKSRVVYSQEELPRVYVYGICEKGDLLWKRAEIIKKVQDRLKRNMKQDLEGEIVCVAEMKEYQQARCFEYQLYCLEFNLPYEIVYPEESEDEEMKEMEEFEDFGFPRKKLHI